MKSIAHLKQTYVRPDVQNTWWNKLSINFIVMPIVLLLHTCTCIGEKLDPFTAPIKSIVEPRIRMVEEFLFPETPNVEQDFILLLIIMAVTSLGFAMIL
jgi:hypothetical protein